MHAIAIEMVEMIVNTH